MKEILNRVNLGNIQCVVVGGSRSIVLFTFLVIATYFYTVKLLNKKKNENDANVWSHYLFFTAISISLNNFETGLKI